MKKIISLAILAGFGLTACGPQVAERDDNGLIDAVLNGDGSVEQSVTIDRAPESNGPSEAPIAEDADLEENE